MGTSIIKNKLTTYNYFELGVNVKYAISGAQIDNLRKFLSETSIAQDFLYNDQSEYLVSVRAYPFWMDKFFDGVQPYGGISIGPFNPSDTHLQGCMLQSQKIPVKIVDSFSFTRYYDNFMDFAPYTKITAYIPYIGFREINVNEVMGKTINMYAQVDFDNGILTVWLEIYESASVQYITQSWETQIGVDIAVNRTNGTELARNLYMWGIKSVFSAGGLMGSAGSKGVTDYGKSIKTGGDVATGFIGANQHHVSRGNIGTGVNELFNPTSVYFIFEREVPEFTTLTDYAHIYGLPLSQAVNLSSLTGYTEIGEIHFNPMGYDIYDDEINEIEQLLRGGVHL